MSQTIHFIGIGGIGVSALAQVALARGNRVSGSDLNVDTALNPALARLIREGAVIHGGHRASNVSSDVTLVVATAAAHDENPEIAEARSRGLRIVSRAQYLGETMTAHRGVKIAVAGTHGKTTTTAMIGVMLQHAGLDPTVFVGGEVSQLGGNVRVGSPEGLFVAEACEAYDSFLALHPDVAIVTNVEPDHLDHFGTDEAVFAAFDGFLGGLNHNGRIVGCADDLGVRRLLSARPDDITGCALTYGIDAEDADLRAQDVTLSGLPTFTLAGRLCKEDIPVRLSVPGRHNVLNALAAAATGSLVGLTPEQIADGLGEFRGATRRQEILGEARLGDGTALVIDDYAHHPTEIAATIDALRGTHPDRRMVAVFQPHLYSRTRDFLREFGRSLAGADVLIVTDIYAAREAPIDGVDPAEIVTVSRSIRPAMDALYVANRKEIPAVLSEKARKGDLVVFMGAGDIREQGEEFVRLCASGEAS